MSNALCYLIRRAEYYRLGSVDLSTVEKVEVVIKDEEKARLERFGRRPILSEILNLHDFEVMPCVLFTYDALKYLVDTYYSSFL